MSEPELCESKSIDLAANHRRPDGKFLPGQPYKVTHPLFTPEIGRLMGHKHAALTVECAEQGLLDYLTACVEHGKRFTITGLALWLGITYGRLCVYRRGEIGTPADRERFRYIFSVADTLLHARLEDALTDPDQRNVSGVAFALKSQFKEIWSEKDNGSTPDQRVVVNIAVCNTIPVGSAIALTHGDQARDEGDGWL